MFKSIISGCFSILSLEHIYLVYFVRKQANVVAYILTREVRFQTCPINLSLVCNSEHYQLYIFFQDNLYLVLTYVPSYKNFEFVTDLYYQYFFFQKKYGCLQHFSFTSLIET